MRLSTASLTLFLFSRTALSGITCGVCSGYDRGVNAYYYSGDGSLADFESCSATCQSDTKCQSFAFGDSQCLLYSEPLEDNFRQQSGSPFLFYDRNCVNIEPTSSFTTELAPTTQKSSPSVAIATALPDVTISTPAATTSETSDGDGNGDPGSASSGQSSGPTVPAKTGASETGTSPTTLATVTAGASGSSASDPSSSVSSTSGTSESSDTSSSGTTASVSTSAPDGSSESSGSNSVAGTLLHGSRWTALLGLSCLVSIIL